MALSRDPDAIGPIASVHAPTLMTAENGKKDPGQSLEAETDERRRQAAERRPFDGARHRPQR
jgi:hypothetical protein